MICIICVVINKDIMLTLVWTPEPHSILSVTGWRLNKTTADWLQLSPSFCVVGGLVEWRSGQCNYVCSLLLLLLLLQSKARIKGSWKGGGRRDWPSSQPEHRTVSSSDEKGAHFVCFSHLLVMNACGKCGHFTIGVLWWYFHSSNFMRFPIK